MLQLETNRTQLFGYLTNQHHLVGTERDYFGEEQLLTRALGVCHLVQETMVQYRYMGAMLVDHRQPFFARQEDVLTVILPEGSALYLCQQHSRGLCSVRRSRSVSEAV